MVQHPGTGQQARVIGGRYQVTGELGRGGMGIVWRAWDQVIGREVAIKELHLPDGVPPAERQVYEERVLREARTAGRLNDPAVVTVHDVLAEAGTTYIVMELVRAVTLTELVAQRGPLAPEQAADLARQVLSALENAHAAGIVHRDVKPSNIMVADGRVKLADFGIAQTLDDPRLTSSGAIVGSPSFMAPERIQGADASPAGDLWSLGATLFFAVEGWMPFERQTTAATLNAVLNETPRATRPHGVVGPVITGLLIADPKARFTAAQVRALLASTPASEAVTRPAGVAPTAVAAQAPHGRRGLWASVAAVAAVVLFAAGLLVGRFGLGGSTPVAMEPTLTFGAGGDIQRFHFPSSTGCSDGALAPGGSFGESDSRTCTDPHDHEIFHSGSVFSSGETDVDYPGEEELQRFGEGLCSAFFNSDQIVIPAKETALRYVALVPTEQSWNLRRTVRADDNSDNDDQGSQTVYCGLRSADGKKLTTKATL
ncbi:serine/threonine protein kinase [Saccharopolyspora erythraea NRRL 2338]|uniref:non-specific serine/threonine protein kinase n=2 Tax=Saccharopolyspora erythraea TaxID=1836 RepID=A4FM09_SACEN|nr:serine/threonine-protein kinase [Saccharopolyspora erythraea]EQD88222.1 protein kinase [Saccharopolyspora erythraea D]PFG98722.1 serine/threonine protein kinase [Saccharopolyspora erythraea NRRL 2338]QRK88731.1 serine/threonine protein kinase [Saccharopolyspora erythraea]CAM05084.1 serine/threonine protein kinase [Saccharopolyspora erythraea NRRL 2338]